LSQIFWTLPAVEHLKEIRAHISQDSLAAASRVVRAIREQVKPHAQHPQMGRRGVIEGTRELVISRLPYLVVYQHKDEIVTVLAVVHTARNWAPDLGSGIS
jgi:toxin ParE1/3/4